MTSQHNRSPSPPWSIRPSAVQDRTLVAKLLSSAPERHIHLDWYTAYDLLDECPSLLAIEGDQAIGILACPQDPPGIGWIRYFAVGEGSPTGIIWEALWEQTRSLARQCNIQTIAALVTQPWFIPILKTHGFMQATEVIFLERKGEAIEVDLPLHATLRRMTGNDLAAVASVDQLAFKPMWQHSQRALEAAFHLTAFATVMEVEERIVAYQMSTASALGAHLARLAVEPAMQAQGLAKALVAHAIRHFLKRGIDRVSVNTQADNQRSQLLYEKLGFIPTGQRYPVYQFEL